MQVPMQTPVNLMTFLLLEHHAVIYINNSITLQIYCNIKSVMFLSNM